MPHLPVKDQHRIAEVELVHCPGGRNIEEASLLFRLSFVDSLRVGKPAFCTPDEEDGPPFEALCLVDGARAPSSPPLLRRLPLLLRRSMPLMRESSLRNADERIVLSGEVDELADILQTILVVRIGVLQILQIAVFQNGRDHVGRRLVLLEGFETH